MQENESSQMNFGCTGGGKVQRGHFHLPLPLLAVSRLVCSSSFGKHWAVKPRADLAQQSKLPHRISSHPCFPEPVSCLLSGRFAFSLPVMLAVSCRQNFHLVQTFHVSKAWFSKGSCLGDSWDILHGWEPISRDRNPDQPSPLPKTAAEQLKARVSHNLARFCPSSVPQEGLSLCWLCRCHPTHTLWLGQTPPPQTWAFLCT